MIKVNIQLIGDAERFFKQLREDGMSSAAIIGKALKCLEMTQKKELEVKKPTLSISGATKDNLDIPDMDTTQYFQAVTKEDLNEWTKKDSEDK